MLNDTWSQVEGFALAWSVVGTLISLYSYKLSMLGLMAANADPELLKKLKLISTPVEKRAAQWFFSESLLMLLFFTGGIALNTIAGLAPPTQLPTEGGPLPASTIAGWTRLAIGMAATVHLVFSLWCRATITGMLSSEAVDRQSG